MNLARRNWRGEWHVDEHHTIYIDKITNTLKIPADKRICFWEIYMAGDLQWKLFLYRVAFVAGHRGGNLCDFGNTLGSTGGF